MTAGQDILVAFPESAQAAARLAAALGLPCRLAELHRFPDGESLLSIEDAEKVRRVILYRSLDRPNDKLVELLLAASLLRGAGAERLILVAPYLCYMRQDRAFRPGEAVSQAAVCGFLDQLFDALVTVDPHLHRTPSLAPLFRTSPALALSAAPLLSEALRTPSGAPPILVGPDAESRQWVEAVAAPLGLEVLVAEKQRHGDVDVTIEIPGVEAVAGRRTVLIDDLVSSGATLATCARRLLDAGASRVEALAVHWLGDPEATKRLEQAGLAQLRASDSVGEADDSLPLAPLLAPAIRKLLS